MTGFLQVYVYMCYFAVSVGLKSVFMKKGKHLWTWCQMSAHLFSSNLH